jgi:glycosyltransferase involved in cell wall biosynthesis
MKVTLVSTVFNEAKRIQDTIDDINNQSVLPDEVIITDAGSTDNTFQILEHWASSAAFTVRVLLWPTCNVAEGRNKAIAESRNELILSTDFGCRFNPLWIESMLKPFEDSTVQVVGGTYAVIEKDIVTTAAKANYIICDGYYVTPHEGFIPSSRSIAYYKSVWEQVGGYPEWLTLAADDLVFGMILLKQQHKIAYVHTPYVYWGRHATLKAYAKEAYRYGLGDGEAKVNVRQCISKLLETALRYYFLIGVVLFAILKVFYHLNWFVAAPLLVGLLGFRSYYWAFKNWLKYNHSNYGIQVLFQTIPLIEYSRIQYIKGYIKGYFYSSEKVAMGAVSLKRALK